MDGTITASSSSASTAYPPLSGIQAQLVRAGMMTFIVSMCVALPVTLFPQYVAYKLGLLNKTRKERLALSTGQFCARWLTDSDHSVLQFASGIGNVFES
jgi:hypothetical protein